MNERIMEEKEKPRIGRLCKFWDDEEEPKGRFDYVISYLRDIQENKYGTINEYYYDSCRELTPDDLVLKKQKLPRPEIGTPVCCFDDSCIFFIICPFGKHLEGNDEDMKIVKCFHYAKIIPSLTSMRVEDLINHADFQEYEV